MRRIFLGKNNPRYMNLLHLTRSLMMSRETTAWSTGPFTRECKSLCRQCHPSMNRNAIATEIATSALERSRAKN